MPRIKPTKTKSHARTSKTSITALEAITLAAIVSGILYFTRRQRNTIRPSASPILRVEDGYMNELYNTKLSKSEFTKPSGTIDFSGFVTHFEIIEMPSDGSCMYHSILKGLRTQGLAKKIDIMFLRKIAYTEICESEPNKYKPALAAIGELPDKYCKELEESTKNPEKSVWGDDFVLAALSKQMNITFKIVREEAGHKMTWHTIGPPFVKNNIIVILHFVNRNHYNVVVPLHSPEWVAR